MTIIFTFSFFSKFCDESKIYLHYKCEQTLESIVHQSINLIIKITGVLGGPLSLGVFKSAIQRCWERIWDKCIGSCSTGSRGVDCDINTGNSGALQGNF